MRALECLICFLWIGYIHVPFQDTRMSYKLVYFGVFEAAILYSVVFMRRQQYREQMFVCASIIFNTFAYIKKHNINLNLLINSFAFCSTYFSLYIFVIMFHSNLLVGVSMGWYGVPPLIECVCEWLLVVVGGLVLVNLLSQVGIVSRDMKHLIKR